MLREKRAFALFLVVFAMASGMFFSVSVHAKDVSVVYTGNTYASLYPCGVCPASVGGGVLRRAAVLRRMASEKDLIVVDAGNFTASGIFDTKSIGPLEDKKRSRIYYQAMAEMGYEVAALGENELAFGVDFLRQAAENLPFTLISSNIDLAGIKPYYLKSLEGTTIGFIALSPQSIYKKYGIEVKDYRDSLKKVLKKLKGKCQAVILLSAIGEEESIKAVKDFPEITAVIISGHLHSASGVVGRKKPFLARSSFEGKVLRALDLDLETISSGSISFSEQALSLDIDEDSELKRVIPSCFRDEDCLKRDSLVSQCQQPGETDSVCAYYSAKEIPVQIVTDINCPFCSTELTEKLLKDIFIGVTFIKFDYRSPSAQELIKEHKATTLPLFIADSSLAQAKGFEKVRGLVQKSRDSYVLSADLAGMFMFLDRKELPARIDFFIDLYQSEADLVFDKLRKFSKTEKVFLGIHFIKSTQQEFNYAGEERDVALAVKEAFPEKINDYVLLRSKQIKSRSWVNTLDELKINYKAIQRVLSSKKMEELRDNNNSLIDEIGVKEGNVILINNNKVFKVFDIDPEDLKTMVK
jgi:hypothetical protein